MQLHVVSQKRKRRGKVSRPCYAEDCDLGGDDEGMKATYSSSGAVRAAGCSSASAAAAVVAVVCIP